MKKLFCFLLISATLLVSNCSLFDRETSVERVERITGYDLPNDMEEEYYLLGKTFTGCAGQYSVYSVDNEPEILKEILKEEYNLNRKVDDNQIASIERDFSSNNVPETYRINFNEDYRYITGEENTYIFFFPAENRVKIWMFGH